MAAVAGAPPLGRSPSTSAGPRRVALPGAGRLALRLTAFVGFAVLAAERFASLDLGPPRGRVLAAVVIAAAGGAALALSAGLGDGGAEAGAAGRLAVRALIALATLFLALRVVGVPGHLLWPWRWSALAAQVGHGFDGLSGWLWPYRGGDRWARLTVLMVAPMVLVASAALVLWPTPRTPLLRRTLGLGLLTGLYVAGVVNASHAGWAVEGLLLFAAIAAWLYLPGLDVRGGAVAGAWLLAGGALAVAGAATLTGGRPWLNYRAWNPTGTVATSFQWDQSYGPITWSRSTAPMLAVSSSRPELWKVTALDLFDGRRFARSASPPGGYDFGSTPDAGRWFYQAAFTVAGLRSPLLAGAGSALEVGWLSANTQDVSVTADETAQVATALAPGDSYQVTYYSPHPSPAQMRAAPAAYPRSYEYYTEVQLPPAPGAVAPVLRARAPRVAPAADPVGTADVLRSPYAPVYRLARALARGQRTEYDVALRMQRFLKSTYAYDERPPLSQFPLISFLFTDRRGYCQQFSGAMALMLRMDGIPARVAAGFQSGRFDPATHSYRVRAVDAHSWVEVYFAGIGWVAFDPTPPRRAPGRAAPAASSPFSDSLLAQASGGRIALPRRRPEPGPAAGGPVPRASSAWPIVGIGIGVALVALLAGWLARASRRVRRALRDDTGEAVRELSAALRALGYPVAPRTTLAQLERRLAGTRGQEAAGYVRLLAARRFAGAPVAAGPTRRDRRALRRALAEGRGPVARLMSFVALPPAL
jgi:transglutaminase-like putative cysteine protease